MTRLILPILLLFLAATSPAAAQAITFDTAVQSIKARIEPAEAKAGQTVKYKLTIELFPDHWTYPTVQSNLKEKATVNKFQLPPAGDLIFVEPISDPPDSHTKPSPEGGELVYYPDGATWEFTAVVSPKATPGEKEIAVRLAKILVCNNQGCISPGSVPIKEVGAKFKVLPGSVEVEPRYRDKVEQVLAATTAPTRKADPPLPSTEPGPPPSKGPQKEGPTPKPPPKTIDTNPPTPVPEVETKVVARRLSVYQDYAADMQVILDQLPPPDRGKTNIWVFIATAAFWGFVTLLTPCVFPMIPITVSIFLKQSEKQGTNMLALALVYAVTIVVLLSIAALTLLTTFSRLAVNPITNVLLGLLFVVLALSLFGLFELTLPTSLSTALDNRAARGGYIGTVFMAASFTVVSFTCVAPFLGGFTGMSASGSFSIWELAAGALAFATAFASPFFLLALFPSLIKKIPKSGDWMNMIKVAMGFLELAAALKFFRTAELRWLTPPQYFTYDMVLAMWVAILVAMSLYLFGMFRTAHDHEMHDHVGPFRIIFALASLGLAVYLTPALFGNGGNERNRPGGIVYAWIDSFLLPEPSSTEMVGRGELPWSADLRRALDDARARNGRVFIDFTGVTCTNCKLNEKEVFTKPEVKELLKQFTLVQLYTDTVPEGFYESAPGDTRQDLDAAINLKFEKQAFGEEQLPLYVILKPEAGRKVTVLGVYREGKINNVPGFVEFLKNGLK